MIFQSKFGLGEIVHYTTKGKSRGNHDELLKVLEVGFNTRGIIYLCRWPNGIVGSFAQNELDGDPDYNQTTGYKDNP